MLTEHISSLVSSYRVAGQKLTLVWHCGSLVASMISSHVATSNNYFCGGKFSG